MRDPMLHSWGRKLRRRHRRDPDFMARKRLAQARAGIAEAHAQARDAREDRRRLAVSLARVQEEFRAVIGLRAGVDQRLFGGLDSGGVRVAAQTNVSGTLVAGLFSSFGEKRLREMVAKDIADQLVSEMATLR